MSRGVVSCLTLLLCLILEAGQQNPTRRQSSDYSKAERKAWREEGSMGGLMKDVGKVAALRGRWKCSRERTNGAASPNVIDGMNGGGGGASPPCCLCECGFLAFDHPG